MMHFVLDGASGPTEAERDEFAARDRVRAIVNGAMERFIEHALNTNLSSEEIISQFTKEVQPEIKEYRMRQTAP